ncbi:hypothetical protein SAMN02745883_02163 [Caminicella sporogenes DSM 14501]|uniref:AEC family transporter n=1 Tax=Caminicella sporogenes DSM 14501 TaxID=1121266 RepID=A0A1M6SVT7_9FIRM|nr:AEC family transporter [Caminicella sporogenes]RKD21916.1 transporter [Caminicella sporogenes]SHK48824.1 hypothetical protein SAMN02745883_02163 [Caminicella sporogenes DSM 14501]
MAALEQVFVLFLLIVVGYVIKKLKIITNDMNRDISNLVLYVTLPAFIITAMNFSFSPDVLIKSGKLVIISFCIYAFIISLSYMFCKILNLKNKTRDIFQYAMVFSNVGYMGYPVTKAVFGDLGVFYAAIYNLPFNILVWTFGIFLMTRLKRRENNHFVKGSKINLKLFINPGFVAVCIGFTLFLFSIKLPTPIFSTLRMLGGVTTPLSMLFIGSILADVKFSEIISDIKVYLLCMIRLLILPLLVLVILKILGFNDYLVAIPTIITAMPVAANAAIMASKYENDYKLASKAIFLSTMFSIITIPFIVMLIR